MRYLALLSIVSFIASFQFETTFAFAADLPILHAPNTTNVTIRIAYHDIVAAVPVVPIDLDYLEPYMSSPEFVSEAKNLFSCLKTATKLNLLLLANTTMPDSKTVQQLGLLPSEVVLKSALSEKQKFSIMGILLKTTEEMNALFGCVQKLYPMPDKHECCDANKQIPVECAHLCSGNISYEMATKCVDNQKFPLYQTLDGIQKCYQQPKKTAPGKVFKLMGRRFGFGTVGTLFETAFGDGSKNGVLCMVDTKECLEVGKATIKAGNAAGFAKGSGKAGKIVTASVVGVGAGIIGGCILADNIC